MATDRRAAILAAARECFAERGVEESTIEHVRTRSGASVGSIYHHFGDKEGLVAALYLEALRDYQGGLLVLVGRGPGAERGVKAIVRHHLRWVSANPDLARLLLIGRPLGTSDELAELNRELAASTGAWLRAHFKAGELRRVPLDLAYTLLIGPAQEFSRQWLAGRMASSMRTAERTLAELAWRALRPD